MLTCLCFVSLWLISQLKVAICNVTFQKNGWQLARRLWRSARSNLPTRHDNVGHPNGSLSFSTNIRFYFDNFGSSGHFAQECTFIKRHGEAFDPNTSLLIWKSKINFHPWPNVKLIKSFNTFFSDAFWWFSLDIINGPEKSIKIECIWICIISNT